MASASSCRAARTTSSTLRLWPRWITSAPCAWISRRMMLMAASWPSNRLAAVTKRKGAPLSARAVDCGCGRVSAGVLMDCIHTSAKAIPDCNARVRMARTPPYPPPMRPRLLPPAVLALALALAACRHAPPAPPASPQVLLLGEVHDSAAGHAARAALLREKVEAGWRPAIAMEQFDT